MVLRCGREGPRPGRCSSHAVHGGARLLGKFAAHVSYLMVLAGIALAAGLYPFLRYGTGPFLPVAFVSVFLLIVTPALLLTTAFALLFDVLRLPPPHVFRRASAVLQGALLLLLLLNAFVALAAAAIPLAAWRVWCALQWAPASPLLSYYTSYASTVSPFSYGAGLRSLAEVALEVGFGSQSQLTRHFKKIIGATPGQYAGQIRA